MDLLNIFFTNFFKDYYHIVSSYGVFEPFIVAADDVVRRRQYCNDFVMMYVMGMLER